MKTTLLTLLLAAATLALADDKAPPPPAGQDQQQQQQQFYKPPNPEVVRTHLHKLFDEELDKDGDKYVSSAELKEYLKKFHSRLILDSIDKQWEYFDKEMQEKLPGVKVLKWDTYKKLSFPDRDLDKAASEEAKAALAMLDRTERRWKLADFDGDGALDKTEFKSFLHPEEDERVRHVVVTEAVELMDTDKNGIVSFEEYMDHLRRVSGPEKDKDKNWAPAQQSHFSTYLDKDKDGALNEAEMRDWVLPSHDREEGEAWRLISVGDVNQDTKLTKEEVAAAPDYFMGILPHEFWQQEGHAGGVKQREEL
uniref:Reticulocalbin-3 n=1 Tax=Amblyomma maculatum TaxID=34609 RepID=G3MTL2_AMBMU